MQKIFTSIIFFFIIVSCSQNPARIYYKGGNIYNKEYYRDLYEHKKNLTSVNDNEDNSSKKSDFVAGNFIIVKKGDTLYSLAKANSVALKDVIESNNLLPPYNIKVGQKIIIPKSETYVVKRGDTLYSIARKLKISLSSLASVNGVSEPFIISPGQKLNIPSALASEDVVKIAKHETKKYQPHEKSEHVSSGGDHNNDFSWPVRGAIVSKFGPKKGGLYNDGINIKAKFGENVRAAEDGVVAYVGNELRGYGNLVIIKHANGWISAYAHCDKILVKKNDKVSKNSTIAKVGKTGNVKDEQLYFSLRKGKKALNPEQYLS